MLSGCFAERAIMTLSMDHGPERLLAAHWKESGIIAHKSKDVAFLLARYWEGLECFRYERKSTLDDTSELLAECKRENVKLMASRAEMAAAATETKKALPVDSGIDPFVQALNSISTVETPLPTLAASTAIRRESTKTGTATLTWDSNHLTALVADFGPQSWLAIAPTPIVLAEPLDACSTALGAMREFDDQKFYQDKLVLVKRGQAGLLLAKGSRELALMSTKIYEKKLRIRICTSSVRNVIFFLSTTLKST